MANHLTALLLFVAVGISFLSALGLVIHALVALYRERVADGRAEPQPATFPPMLQCFSRPLK